MLIYQNVGRFQLDEYGEKRIVKESVVTQIQPDTERPSWINTVIESNLLIDETSLLQLG